MDAMDAMDDDTFEKTCSKIKHISYHIPEPSRNSLSESLYFCFQSVLLRISGEPKKKYGFLTVGPQNAMILYFIFC